MPTALKKKENTHTGDARDTGSIPGSGRSPGVGNGNPLKCSYFLITKMPLVHAHSEADCQNTVIGVL